MLSWLRSALVCVEIRNIVGMSSHIVGMSSHSLLFHSTGLDKIEHLLLQFQETRTYQA